MGTAAFGAKGSKERVATPPPPPVPVTGIAGTFCRNVVILRGSMFFSENACRYCQPSTVVVHFASNTFVPPSTGRDVEMLFLCLQGGIPD